MPRKKSHKKTAGRKGRRTVKKGGYYGFDGKVGTGAPLWSAAQEVSVPSYATKGARRRKTRKTRGGGGFQTSAAGFVGTGSRGIPDYVDIGSTRGASALGAFNIKSS